MESSHENSTNSQNNTEIGELLEEKGQDSLQANFQSSSVEIKENTIKKEPINKILIVEEKKTTEKYKINKHSLIRNNGLKDPNYLYEGQTLRLPVNLSKTSSKSFSKSTNT